MNSIRQADRISHFIHQRRTRAPRHVQQPDALAPEVGAHDGGDARHLGARYGCIDTMRSGFQFVVSMRDRILRICICRSHLDEVVLPHPVHPRAHKVVHQVVLRGDAVIITSHTRVCRKGRES